uniref:Uncharacterized protein n=1 Tax=Lepeophtheirus salmonis TaxID=72036 RepID=A0A0K2SY75_LEPSM
MDLVLGGGVIYLCLLPPDSHLLYFFVCTKFISRDVPCSERAHRKKENTTPQRGFRNASTLLVPGRNIIYPRCTLIQLWIVQGINRYTFINQ